MEALDSLSSLVLAIKEDEQLKVELLQILNRPESDRQALLSELSKNLESRGYQEQVKASLKLIKIPQVATTIRSIVNS